MKNKTESAYIRAFEETKKILKINPEQKISEFE